MKFRKIIRLRNYNYKTNGYYFITICTNYHRPYLKYNGIQKIVVAELALLSKRFKGTKIDYSILMPTHIHIILILENSKHRLDQIIQAFKSITTIKSKQALTLQIKKHLWQPNYYEHIIRNEKALYEIRKYIQENPEKEKIDLKSIYNHTRLPEQRGGQVNLTATNMSNINIVNIVKNIVIGIIIFVFSSNLVFAVDNTGTTGLNFLKIGVGPKAIGMGGAFSAVADDASAVYWNPAGLVQLGHREISFMHFSWFEGINYQFAGYVHPTEHYGSFGASIYYLSSEDITAYDNSGGELADRTRIHDLALGVSYSQHIRKIKGLDAGITLKLIQENLADELVNIPTLDFGVLYRIGRLGRLGTDESRNELKIAFVAQNLGPEIMFFRDSYPLPRNFKIGISYELLNKSLVLALDNNFPRDREPFLNVGFGYRIADFIVLRAGFKLGQNRHQYDSDEGLRFGIGLGNNYLSIDYALVPYGVLGNTHRLGLTYRFGKRYDIDLIESNIERHVQKGRRYYQRKDLISAYREFNNVLVLDPINSEAKKYLQKIKEHTDEIVIEKQLESVKTYINEDKLAEAKEQLGIILDLSPGHTLAKDYLAQVNMKLQEKSEQRIDAMFKQGIEFYKLREYGGAISLWEKVLMLDPEYEETKKYISLAQQELARIEFIEKEKERENRIEKSNELYNKGLKLYKSGGLEKAKEMFEESIKLNPEQKGSISYLTKIKSQLAEGYYNEGLKYYEENNLETSVIYLQKAFSFNPQEQKIKELLDKAQFEFNEEKKAKAEDYNKQGLIEYTQGNLGKAIEFWEKALELDPENAKIKNSLKRAEEDMEKR